MAAGRRSKPPAVPAPPRRLVLVLQGGGALGAYQAGVYAGMHEAGLEPDWVIGTSIGAINAAIIAGNPPEKRVERLDAFWTGVEQDAATMFGLALRGRRGARAVEPRDRGERHSRLLRAESRGLGRAARAGRRRAGGALLGRAPARDARGAGRLRPHPLTGDASHRRCGAGHARRSCATSTTATTSSASSTSSPRARCRRRSPRCASTASRTGTAGSTRTRRSRRSSTTSRAATRSSSTCRSGTRTGPSPRPCGTSSAARRTSSTRAAPTATSPARSRSTGCAT